MQSNGEAARESDRAGISARRSRRGQLRAQYRVILRITAMMLCCAVLFLSGFYLGIYQGSPGYVPDRGVYTETYTSEPIVESVQTSAGFPTIAAPDPVLAPPTPEQLLASLKWPVDGKISKEPGWVHSDYLNQWVYLSGVEIGCEAGSPVTAALGGSVKSVTVDPLLGTMIKLQHDGGLETTYGRVSAVSIAPGEKVALGDAIASGGAGGLYFSLTLDGEPISARECLATAK